MCIRDSSPTSTSAIMGKAITTVSSKCCWNRMMKFISAVDCTYWNVNHSILIGNDSNCIICRFYCWSTCMLSSCVVCFMFPRKRNGSLFFFHCCYYYNYLLKTLSFTASFLLDFLESSVFYCNFATHALLPTRISFNLHVRNICLGLLTTWIKIGS